MFPSLSAVPVKRLMTVLLCAMAACKTNDKTAPGALNRDELFFDYQVAGREGDDNLTVLLRFRQGDQDGDAISIEEWAAVALDGEVLPVDTAKMTGVYYETHRPIDGFSGQHSIELLVNGQSEYKVPFSFYPLILASGVTDTLSRDDVVFQFEGLDSEELLTVVLLNIESDTEGINRVDTIRDGRLVIPRNELESLAAGPVHAEFIREQETEVKNGTKPGGRLLVNYSLSRQFFLKDQPE